MIENVYPKDYDVLCAIWESAVLSTHDFLSKEDFEYYRACLPTYFGFVDLYGYGNEKGELLGFIGVKGDSIEMLFIHNEYRGKGIGRELVTFARQEKGVSVVEVNEQNTQAVGFYKRIGFVQIDRYEQDAAGKPYPILKMQLEDKIKFSLCF